MPAMICRRFHKRFVSRLIPAGIVFVLLAQAVGLPIAASAFEAEVPISPVGLGELGIDIAQFDISAIDLGGVTSGFDVTGSIGSLLGGLLGGAGSYVPVFDRPNFGVNTRTAGATTYLQGKSIQDQITTAILKMAIQLVRDMVIRWIVTGNFGGPVFSASFSIDIARSAENAARIFLSQLTGINFCAGISLPPQSFFARDISLALACTFPGDYGGFLQGNSGDFVSLWASEQTENDFWNAEVAVLDAKLKTEQRAVSAFEKEYLAGSGFLCIRDPNTGKCTTPGSAVAEMVMQSQIVSPIRQTDVADDVQTAIAAIINTAIQVFIERGLAATTSSSPLPSQISGQQTFQFPPPPPPPAPAPPPPPPPPPPIPAPTLTAFCGNAGSSVTIQWQAAGQNASGFEIQVDDNNNQFDGFWAKLAAPSALSTIAPTGFDPTAGASAPPSAFSAGASYQVRVHYLQTSRFSPQTIFTALDCSPPPTPAVINL